MIDLHTHTDQSDGTVSPSMLVQQAIELGLEALAITDHDTLDGYDLAAASLQGSELELICGIELSTKLAGSSRSVHLLGYFFEEPAKEFREWIEVLQEGRRERNRQLVRRLQELGMEIQLEEVQALGKNLTGRPHFAGLLLKKGFVATLQEAFDSYLGETGAAYVDRDEPDLRESVLRIQKAGGLPSLAHPMRISRDPHYLETLITELSTCAPLAIEAHHSEHTAEDTSFLMLLAKNHDLPLSGGSDFHGANKPGISLGTGRNGNLAIPSELLEGMRSIRVGT